MNSRSYLVTGPTTATALIADDHPRMREVIGASLSDIAGVKVVGVAADGEEAVRLALELRLALVTVDVAIVMGPGHPGDAREVQG